MAEETGQSPPLPPLTSVTTLTETNTSPPRAIARVVSSLDRNTGRINTQVISPEGVILHSGSPQQVADEVSRTSDSPNKDQILSAVQRQDSNLTQAYQKQTAAATAKQAQENTGETPEQKPADAEATAKIEKGNQPPAETPPPPAPPPAPPAQQPTAGNNEDRAPTEQETRSDSTSRQNQTPKSGTIGGNNPLDNYASYTYNFILAALDPKEEYNQMVSDPNYKYKLKNVLIASGARRDTVNYPRDPRFNAEFFLEDVKFDTIIGLNSRNKSSNALSLSFTIKEPYGVTFFDRLYELSLSNPNYRNYIEMPYLFVIEFVGYTDDGKPVKIAEHTKYIPIKLVYASMKVNGAGSEYQCQAVPFNQMSQMATEHGSTPINVQVTAKNVAEFFADIEDNSIAAQYTSDRNQVRDRENIINQTVDLEGNFEEDRRKQVSEIVGEFRKKYYNAKSYPQALDAFQRLVVDDKKARHRNTYRFVIDPLIAESVLYTPSKTPSNRQQFNNDTRVGANDGNKDRGEGAIFNINGGTSIIDVINMVMRNSDYIRGQVTDKETAKIADSGADAQKIADAAKKPINWFKITSVIKLLEYDDQRNTFAKEIVFYIDPYTVFNSKSPLVPKSFPNNWLQEYNYIFTGDNRSIIDLDLKFDTLFNVLSTVNPNKWKAMNFGPASAGDVEVDYDTSTARSFMPTKFVPQAGNMPDQVGNVASETATNVKVSDLYNTILTSSAADMIQVDLTIVGDPRYIKQDDVLYNSGNDAEIKSKQRTSTKNGSYIFDYEERYVRLNFKTPTDYDPVTGLLSTSRYTVSRFSGLYRIIRVENTLSRGRFTQVLQLVRLFNQPDDYPREDKKNDNSRPAKLPDIWGGIDPFGGLPAITDQRTVDTPAPSMPGGFASDYRDDLSSEISTNPDISPAVDTPQVKASTALSVVEDIDAGDGSYALWDNNTGTYSQRGLTQSDAEKAARSVNTSAAAQGTVLSGVTDNDRLWALRLTQSTGKPVPPEEVSKQRLAGLAAARAQEANYQDFIKSLQKPNPNRDDFLT